MMLKHQTRPLMTSVDLLMCSSKASLYLQAGWWNKIKNEAESIANYVKKN